MSVYNIGPSAPSDEGTKRLRDQVRESLVELIVRGSLKAGEKISEPRLADQLQVSRTPLREALLSLEQERMVRSDLRRGFTIEPLSSAEIRETYPILAQLECFAVRSNASFVPTVIPELIRMNQEFREATGERALVIDTQWHETLSGLSKNSRLRSMIGSLRMAIRRYEHVYMADSALIPISASQHDEIIGALERGDIDRTLDALEENYRFGMETLLRMMPGN